MFDHINYDEKGMPDLISILPELEPPLSGYYRLFAAIFAEIMDHFPEIIDIFAETIDIFAEIIDVFAETIDMFGDVLVVQPYQI